MVVFFIFFGIMAILVLSLFVFVFVRLICFGKWRSTTRRHAVSNSNQIRTTNGYNEQQACFPPNNQADYIHHSTPPPMGSEALLTHSMGHTVGPGVGFSDPIVSFNNFNQTFPQKEQNFRDDVTYKY